MAAPIYNTAAWRNVRDLVLARDGGICRLCGKPGNHVDHIVPWREGGAWYDPANLRCLCRRCNSSRVRRPSQYGAAPSRDW